MAEDQPHRNTTTRTRSLRKNQTKSEGLLWSILRAKQTIIFQGTADMVTPIAGAIRFHKRMTQLGNRCQLVAQKGGSHGYFIFDLDLHQQVMDRTFKFLKFQDLVSP